MSYETKINLYFNKNKILLNCIYIFLILRTCVVLSMFSFKIISDKSQNSFFSESIMNDLTIYNKNLILKSYIKKDF